MNNIHTIIKDLVKELEQSKQKINKLKIKLATKELDIMNLKKEIITLTLPPETDELYLSPPSPPPALHLTAPPSTSIQTHITDSILLRNRNKLKHIITTPSTYKSSNGISLSIIIKQKNSLKPPLPSPPPPPPLPETTYEYMTNAIKKLSTQISDDDLSNSWL